MPESTGEEFNAEEATALLWHCLKTHPLKTLKAVFELGILFFFIAPVWFFKQLETRVDP